MLNIGNKVENESNGNADENNEEPKAPDTLASMNTMSSFVSKVRQEYNAARFICSEDIDGEEAGTAGNDSLLLV